MRLPPGVPTIIHGLPSRVTMVGVIELSGRLPGSILLVSPCTRPYMLATPALAVKSSISLLSSTPVPARRHARAEPVVERVGHGDRIAETIGDRVVRGVRAFVRRRRRASTSQNCRRAAGRSSIAALPRISCRAAARSDCSRNPDRLTGDCDRRTRGAWPRSRNARRCAEP